MTLVVTWLWQGLAIAWITAAAVRAMPRLNAATRHAIWWLALAAVLAIPIAHGLAAIVTGTPPVPGGTPLDVDAAATALVLPPIPGAVAACAAAIWVITAAAGMLRIASSCRAVGRLKRLSSPFDRSREPRLPMWVAARDDSRRGRRAAELRTSDCITGACALGLGRPVILVSRFVSHALGDESLDEIVMHEQAHLDRYDDWSQLLLAGIRSVAGLHPAVRFLARQLDIDREAACDDRVVSCTGNARRYASSLLTVAAASNLEPGGLRVSSGVPAATTTASALRVRVGRLLDPRRDRGAQLASATSLVCATALTVAVAVSTQVAPVVTFLETAAVVTPAAAVAPAIEVRRASEPAPAANVDAAPRGGERPPRREPSRLKRPALFHSQEASDHPFVGKTPDAPPPAPPAATTLDAPPVAPLDSRVVASGGNAPVLGVTLPSSQPAAIESAAPAVAPWETVKTSTASAAGDVARAASETGTRAWQAGVSIGRFMTRASKAGAKVF